MSDLTRKKLGGGIFNAKKGKRKTKEGEWIVGNWKPPVTRSFDFALRRSLQIGTHRHERKERC